MTPINEYEWISTIQKRPSKATDLTLENEDMNRDPLYTLDTILEEIRWTHPATGA